MDVVGVLGRRGLLLLSAALVCAGLAVSAPAASAAGCAGADARPGQVSNGTLAAATRCLVNVQRAQRGLPRLRSNRRLALAARRHASDMARNNYFSHRSRSGATVFDRIRRTGYLRGARFWAIGENIAWGGGSRGTPREIVRAWMNSTGHRANVLDRDFRHLGLGVARGAPVPGVGGATYVNTFGARG
jgi:uncharacterized protein YkwD